MKIKSVLLLIICLTISLVKNIHAEPYTSKDFPSGEILKKAAQVLVSYKVGLNDIEILGKLKADDDRYVVYCNIHHIGNKEITPFNLIKLDTDIWIIGNQQSEAKILQNK